MEDPRLELAVSLALEAGRNAAASLGRVRSTWKRPGERVTEVDLDLQARMLRQVHTWFPGDGVVAEEVGHYSGVDRKFVWVVDPLDGTNNFALGLPCFAVSIGIVRAGDCYAGVVHDPNTGMTFRALRGAGAFSDERRLSVAARPLDEASNVCVRAPVAPALRGVVDGWLARHKLRVFGSVALHLAYAALGAIDLVLDDRAAVWDIAAGGVILLEAGGCLTALDGSGLFPITLGHPHDMPVPFIAGNAVAHKEGLTALRAPAMKR